MNKSFESHPLVIKISKSKKRFDKRFMSESIKLIKYADSLELTVKLDIDPNDKNNYGSWIIHDNQVIIHPRAFYENYVIYTLLHELGHAKFHLENGKKLIEKKYPALCVYDDVEILKNRPWYMRTQKYWLDYIGFEYAAWDAGYDIAIDLGIKIDEKRWNLFKYRCLRNAAWWLQSYVSD